MRQSLRALGYGIVRAGHGLRRHPLAVTLVTGAISVSFMLVGIAQLTGRTVAATAATWRSAHMVVYLDEDTSAERAREINAVLAGLPAVEQSYYVSPDTALQRLRGSLGEHDELVTGLEIGMLPASIEVTLRTGVNDVAATYPVIERLKSVPGVEDVEFAGAWVNSASTLATGLTYASWVLFLILGGACVYIVIAAMGSRLQERHGEAEVLRLLGASSAFVRGPTIIEGMLQGAAGAGIAMLGLWILFRASAGAVNQVLGQAFGAASLTFLPAGHVALFIAAGAALGTAGTWLATRRLADMDAQYG